MLALTSPDFNDKGAIPVRCTCDGQNISPAFRWTGAPAGTVEFLLICEDPDAPNGVFQHWAAYGIPVKRTVLRAGVGMESTDAGFHQAINDFGKPAYGGPCPPKGDKPHAYHFRLSALDASIAGARPGSTCAEIKALAEPHVLESVELIGLFGRN
jgi:Raf kinase inhibitor-like YbhB/YbcL family protein